MLVFRHAGLFDIRQAGGGSSYFYINRTKVGVKLLGGKQIFVPRVLAYCFRISY